MSDTLRHGWLHLDADALRAAIDQGPRHVQAALIRIGKMMDVRLGERAAGQFMQSGPAGGRREDGASGPLFKRRGTIAKALTGGPGGRLVLDAGPASLHFIKSIDPEAVPHAAIHEYGGTIVTIVTQKMRDFFMAKYIETGERMWLAMSLTRKSAFRIRIPARPYLGPALDVELPAILAYGEQELLHATYRALGHIGVA